MINNTAERGFVVLMQTLVFCYPLGTFISHFVKPKWMNRITGLVPSVMYGRVQVHCGHLNVLLLCVHLALQSAFLWLSRILLLLFTSTCSTQVQHHGSHIVACHLSPIAILHSLICFQFKKLSSQKRVSIIYWTLIGLCSESKIAENVL